MRFKFLLIIIFLGYNTVSFGQGRGPVIDDFSRSSCFVQSARGSTLLKGGTGFFLEVNGKTYFITNNHVVGGEFAVEEHVRTLKTPFPADSIPNKIYVRVFDSLYENYAYDIKAFRIKYDKVFKFLGGSRSKKTD